MAVPVFHGLQFEHSHVFPALTIDIKRISGDQLIVYGPELIGPYLLI
jgi:hypothetical protein